MNKSTQSAAAILDTLSPASANVLQDHFETNFRASILAELTKTLGGVVKVADADEAEAPVKRGPGRPKMTQEEKAEKVPGKRGPGRPKLSKAEKARRAKERAAAKEEAATPKKRGPGRPKMTQAEKVAKAAKKSSPRPTAKDGRSASDIIRDDVTKNPEISTADVIAHVEKLGLSCSQPLVSTVRAKTLAAIKAASKGKTSKKPAK